MAKDEILEVAWAEFAEAIDRATPISEGVVYGVCRSLCGNEILVDCEDDLGEVAMVTILYRTPKAAQAAYCKGMKIKIKVSELPENIS